MKLGFTGTEKSMNPTQRQVFRWALRRLRARYGIEELHHGDCVGADAQADQDAREFSIPVVIHPPAERRWRAFCAHSGDVVWEPRPYLERDRDIVAECDVLIATPLEGQEVRRSGTWYTVRQARRSGKPHLVIYPDGRYESTPSGSAQLELDVLELEQ